MKLLFASCHEILEYDEIKLFNEIGIQVFSPGAYLYPESHTEENLRPNLYGLNYDPEDVEAFHALGAPGVDNKERLTKEFVDRFDAVMIMHVPHWIKCNWEAMKHKRVIWRTIGQSVLNNELELKPYKEQGLKIVRYSPKERCIPGYIGEDAVIRFYKDPDELKDWNGEKKQVITFCQSMKKRGPFCNYASFEEVTSKFSRKLFGPGNEDCDCDGGKLSYEDMKKEMRDNRVYFYTGTLPASYTLNFMEAWMTGIPICAIGPSRGNSSIFPGHYLYEIPELIQNGISGFWSDDIKELQFNIRHILDDDNLAKEISRNGREQAIKHFGKEAIAEQWKEFFKTL